MPRVVWSHNTMICRVTNFTPFLLLFGAKVVLPEEIKHKSLRTVVEAPSCPSEAEEKDLLEAERLKAVANLLKYQDETRSWRDAKVKRKDLNVDNLVKVGKTVCDYQKDKARGLPPRRSPRAEAGVFMERGKPLAILYLTKLYNVSIVIYKRAFLISS
jgi:hypothetical protein